MGTERDAQWYDARYSDPMSRYHHEPEMLPYIDAWMYLVESLPRRNDLLIDIGCGPGHFLSLVAALRPNLSLLGLDFSVVAVEMTNKRVGADVARVWNAKTDPLPQSQMYVTTEFLEHVENDLAVLEQIPHRAWVGLTVPTRDDPGHVRWFPKQQDAVDRYSKVLDLMEYSTFKHWHLLIGTRR